MTSPVVGAVLLVQTFQRQSALAAATAGVAIPQICNCDGALTSAVADAAPAIVATRSPLQRFHRCQLAKALARQVQAVGTIQPVFAEVTAAGVGLAFAKIAGADSNFVLAITSAQPRGIAPGLAYILSRMELFYSLSANATNILVFQRYRCYCLSG